MAKEKEDLQVNIEQEWQRVWSAIESTNTAINDYLERGLSTTGKLHVKSVIKHWDLLKQQAELMYDAIDRMKEQQLKAEPVEVEMPWDTDAFRDAWQYWKDYLKEQHHYYMKSRMERKALARLKKVSGDDEQTALSFLDYAEATGYRNFFKVTEKEISGAKPERRSEDGDF